LQASYGTQSYSILTIPRARRVHQSLLTTPASSIVSLFTCVYHVTIKPNLCFQESHSGFADVLILNGPGTCFILCVAVYINKVRVNSCPCGTTNYHLPPAVSRFASSRCHLCRIICTRNVAFPFWKASSSLGRPASFVQDTMAIWLTMFPQICCSVATITFRQRPRRMCWLARVTASSPHRLRVLEFPSCRLCDGTWYLAVAQCTCDVPHADKLSGKIVTSPTLPLMIEGWSLLM
jgi:hypothetical protein